MNDTHFTITVFVVLLPIASCVAMLTKWVSVPDTLALVTVGLIISPMHFLPPVHVSPTLILLIFLPALLFEAAWNFKLQQLRANLLPIQMLALVGVGVSVILIGLIVRYATGISWSAALIFGSMISAADPVSVLSLVRRLGTPPRDRLGWIKRRAVHRPRVELAVESLRTNAIDHFDVRRRHLQPVASGSDDFTYVESSQTYAGRTRRRPINFHERPMCMLVEPKDR